MPLLDHFHPPVSAARHWESFHAGWAVAIRNALNRRLPPRFVAEAQVHLGSRVETDVAEFDTLPPAAGPANGVYGDVAVSSGGGVAVAVEPTVAAADPAPAADLSLVVPTGLIDRFAVEVRDAERDYRLAGAVELVSPGNKDRADARQMFVGKAAGYLLSGVGLVVADVVTSRRANLHNEMLRLHGAADEALMPGSPPTYAGAYAPFPSPDQIRMDVWARPLAVGSPLPALPLKVLGYGFVMIDLEGTYREECVGSRLG